MKKGEKVKYIGKGFLGFDQNDTEMIVFEIESHDLWVEYKGGRMLVRKHEVVTPTSFLPKNSLPGLR